MDEEQEKISSLPTRSSVMAQESKTEKMRTPKRVSVQDYTKVRYKVE
jgi:hypothetical protein